MLPIALELVKFAPMIAGMLGGSKAEDVAAKVVNVAQAVTGQATPDSALAAIQANPDLAMQFQTKVVESHVELANIAMQQEKNELDAARGNAADINATMQAEAKADHWPTYTWRPAIGFAFAFNLVMSSVIILGVFIAQVFALPGADKAIAAMPATLGALAAISGLATPILGIASWFRGKMQADPAIPTDNRG